MSDHSNEKPIRIINTEKTLLFGERISLGLGQALNMMLSPEEAISISSTDLFLMPIDAYLKAYKKKSILIKIHAGQDFKGELYWFFDLKTAILLGGQMRQMTSAAIDEKLQAEKFDSQDQDSFGEVGNQLNGILDRIFRAMTTRKIHLLMDFKKKVYPDEALDKGTFIDEEEYVVMIGKMNLNKYGEHKFSFLFPRSLFETLLRVEVSLDGITPRTLVLYSDNKDFAEKMSKTLNTRHSKLKILENLEELLDPIDVPNLAGVGVDMEKITFPLPSKENIFFKRLVKNRTLQEKPLFFCYGNASPENQKTLIDMGLKEQSLAKSQGDFLSWAHTLIKNSENPK